ncbi:MULTISPECIES: ParB/RepB/Spo0J family partition protein [unclassified Paracoccus (in: a-proteobacteria)]|uniref:ParB/RepB/Spo0J family partition protein n=1 Tax=unclassified Paracoccus (in: a-proteobacteria) TaxID=2688777 RepID=UPI001603ED4E|nr:MULTISPECIES: ParB/RepB/Spo0J family partition protein [unclassified Paracoccus (in: a-proteobacteria)]MBB1492047.1 ParB/RepB/Spo0J family partition protein [Paracoccus sp. MC1854]MBB1497933.1 ParB/RepB/Spo0J family partition protein [Paracoccus sp. MC1862]QQO44323.1 ParB/RepB/Spo0J family partition protein [Paracoccus sp. MC1862]
MADPKPRKGGLGRGLSALMADVELSPGTQSRSTLNVPVEQLIPNPDQPRRQFDPEALAELAASLRNRGVLQPLIVRPHPSEPDLYQIVAGERRWRAAQIAQLHELPVLVRELDDTEVLEVALIENIQRANLNPIEEAASFRQLMDRFGHTQERLAEALDKSRSHISNLLRLLNLPDQVQGFVRDGKISAGHARALITAPDPIAMARKVIDRNLSVRETEALARQVAERPAPVPKQEKDNKDSDTRALEADLSAHLKMRVRIDHAGQDGGRVTVTYHDLEQLDRLCQLLGAGA